MAKGKEEQVQLTEQQAWDFKAFMSGVVDTMFGYYTPDTAYQNLVNLNNNPLEPNYKRVLDALKNAIDNQELLQSYTEFMEWADMTFKRIIEYYANMLSFDLTITCTNASKEDYKTDNYKKDKKRVYDFLDNFDYKTEFQKVVKLMLRNETAYMWLRNNEDASNTKYNLQIMPQKYCQLTNYWDKGFAFDIDMQYFLQPSIDIDAFDPVIKTFYLDVYGKGENRYKPTSQFHKRNGVSNTYHQTSPLYRISGRGNKKLISGAWAFKFQTENFAQIPFLSAMIKDCVMNIPIQQLQYDKNALSARGMLIGEIGMLNTTEKNATAFQPAKLGQLLGYVKNVIGQSIAVGAMPAKDVEFYQYEDKDKELYDRQMRSSVNVGLSASRLIYSNEKMSQEETRNAIITDYNVMKKLYSQFNNFMNYYINNLTMHYKFDFNFTGSNYPFERRDRFDTVMALADKGIVLNDTAFASVIGIKPTQFSRMLEETSADNSWLDNLSQLQSIYTQGKNSQSRGRPVQDEVNSESREYDSSGE